MGNMVGKIIKFFYPVIIFLIIFSFPVNSQNYLITKYSTDNGLPDNRVNDLAQDSLGRIWIAMASGIAMYDGYEWTKFGEKDGVPEIEYVRIKIDEKGVIWLLPKYSENSIVYLKNSVWKLLDFKNLKLPSPLVFNSFDITYYNKSLKIIINTYIKGLIEFDNDKWKRINRSNGLICDTTTSVFYLNDKLYVSTYLGLSVREKNLKFNNISFSSYGLNTKILAIIKKNKSNKSSDDLLLLGENWIGDFHDGRLSNVLKKIWLPFSTINERTLITMDLRQTIFAGNSAAIFECNMKEKTIQRLLFDDLKKDRGATSTFIDFENNIWFTSLRGIYKLSHIPFSNFTTKSGLLENEVSAISEFNNEVMIFGHNYGLSILKNGKINKIYIQNPNLKGNLVSRVLDIYHDELTDQIYFVSIQNGIGILNSNLQLLWRRHKNINRYFSLFKSPKGDLIAQTDSGWYNFIKAKMLPLYFPLIRDAILTNEKNLYLATSNGLIEYNPNKQNRYYSNIFQNNNLYSLSKIKEYGIIVGSTKGLFRLENESLKKFNFNDQDILDPIYFIIQDSSKNIWLGTNNGVLKWDGRYLKRYNKSDGLAGNETNRAAGFVDSKGNVWIGTDEGVSMYLGNEPDYTKFPPKVLLLNCRDHANQKYNITKPVEIKPDKNNLIFYYRGLSFIDEKRNFYQIRLTEINGDYENEFTTYSNSARFNNLAPGDYVFSVRVRNSKGIWSNWKNSAVITVQEHFYNEPLFYLSVFGFLLFGAYTINDYFQQKKYTKRLEVAVDKRTKDLQDTQVQLITSINRYKGIVESQTDLLIRFNENGILTFANDAYCEIFGKTSEELIGKSFVPLIHPDDVDLTFDEIKKLKYPPYRSTIEQRDLTTEGYRWFSWEGYAIHDNFGNVTEIQAVGRDITLQKEVESELEKRVYERTIELQSLISQSPLGILTFDSDGFLTTFNKIANEMFGILTEFLPPVKEFNILNDHFLKKNNYLMNLGELDSPNSFLLTNPVFINEKSNRIYSKLFNHYLVYRIYNVMFDNENKLFVLLLEDVTEQQMSEEISKKLLEEKIRISTIIKTIESERDRVSKELHDGLGHLLTTAKLKLDIIKLKTTSELNEIDDTIKVLINAGDEIRRIINDLKPADVQTFGLVSSIELLVERVRQSSGIKILLSLLGTIQFQDKNTELIVYRIIQEALNNIVKHSQCNLATIELMTISNQLQICISDDGVGFDMRLYSEIFKSYGINNIKERVKSINGKTEIYTEPGKGFKYQIIIPL